MVVAGPGQQAADSAHRRRKLVASLILSVLPAALAGVLFALSPPPELRKEPAIRPPSPKQAAWPPLWHEAEIPVIEAALRLAPGDERARCRLVELLAAKNDTAVAQEQLNRLIERHPESPLAVKAAGDWIAALIRAQREPDWCWLAGIWEHAAAQHPHSAAALSNAAAAMERCGRLLGAIALLERARSLDPEKPEVLARLAGLYVRVTDPLAPGIGPALRRQARRRLMSSCDSALLASVAAGLLQWPPGGPAFNPLTLPPAELHAREEEGRLYLWRALRLDPTNPIAERLMAREEGKRRPPEPSGPREPGGICATNIRSGESHFPVNPGPE